ncbi:uncharacterized protein LOC129570403 [Sitodiplosis mosellana]|uniref:uncharacterized protein LOC129570403 n=1 Tax=Sitodiplosis mosellana TaxID=263140 RepID=UPI002444C6E1|nr:uncharacterized protein LOC129570403 [Sitodiplosis mosellana]
MDQKTVEGEQAEGVNEQQQNMDIKQPPQIFKLNVDCFEKVFDYLSIHDLHSFGQTCKRMQRVAGYFYHQQFSDCFLRYNCGSIGFREYTENLEVRARSPADELDLVNVDWDAFKSVKRIYFRNANLDQIKMMPQEFLSRIEDVILWRCEVNGPFFEGVLGRFPNVKSLKILASGFDDEWVTRKYPKLEHFTWFTQNSASAGKLGSFLRQNPTIRSLSTRLHLLLPNETEVMELELDDLCIRTALLQHSDCEFLNMLHAKGVYKRLHMNTETNKTVVNRLSSLKSFVRFVGRDFTETVDLSSLVDLKVLTFNTKDISDCANIANKPALAQSLEHLNEVNFFAAGVDDIIPFVHLSPKLKKIVVILQLGEDYYNKAIDPVAMNRERKKLLTKTLYVSKVTIYIPELNYLATRWKTTEIDLKLVEIKCIE